MINLEADVYAVIDTTSFIGSVSAKQAEKLVKQWFLDFVIQSRGTNQEYQGNLYCIYPAGPTFNADTTTTESSGERFMAPYSYLLNNEEQFDFVNMTVPGGTTPSVLRNFAYGVGMVTVMRNEDITSNTVVRDDLSTPANINVYFSAFYDDIGGTITHTEHIIDLFDRGGSASSITINETAGVKNIASLAVNLGGKYLTSGLNPSYNNGSNVVFKGVLNDYSYDFGSGVEVVTPSKDVVFVEYLDDTAGEAGQAEGYVLRGAGAAGDLSSQFERTARQDNVASPVTTGDSIPTYLYQSDYDMFQTIYDNNDYDSAGTIIYSCNGFVNRTDADNVNVMGATHVSLIRSMKGATIPLDTWRESTFVKHYEDPAIQGISNYVLLDGLNDASNYLVNNPNSPSYNDLENKGFQAVVDFGDLATDANAGTISFITQDEFNSQIQDALTKINQ